MRTFPGVIHEIWWTLALNHNAILEPLDLPRNHSLCVFWPAFLTPLPSLSMSFFTDTSTENHAQGQCHGKFIQIKRLNPRHGITEPSEGETIVSLQGSRVPPSLPRI